mgnify:FL=1
MIVDINLNKPNVFQSEDLLNVLIMDYKKLKNKINNVQLSMTDRNLYKTLLQYETSYMDGVDLEYLGDGGNKQSKEFYVNFIAMVLEAKKRNLPLNYEKLIRNIEYIWANYY